METRVNFGQYVKEKRLANKQTIEDVSAISGISTSQISRIEKAQRGIPKPPMLEKLAKGIRVPYEELMEKAGYLKNVPVEEVDAVKEFFENHRKADESIEKCLERLRSGDGFHASIIKELENIIADIANHEGINIEEKIFSHNGLTDLINSMDLNLTQKLELIDKLNELSISMQSNSKENKVYIEIDNLENCIFSQSGVALDDDTQAQLKAVLRAVLKM